MAKKSDRDFALVSALVIELNLKEIEELAPHAVNTAVIKNGLSAFVRFLKEADPPVPQHQVTAMMRILHAGTLALQDG